MRRTSAIAIAIAVLLSATTAFAQNYPTKPIRVIVPFPPGGSVGVIARMIGEKLTAAWGQPVIVEPKPGAGGTLATEAVTKAAPDGHTIMMATANVAINPSLYKKLSFDTEKDLAPIGQIIMVPNVIVAHTDLPAKSIADLIALAKKEPGKLNYSQAGTGSFPHLAFELFKLKAGVDITAIPYKGNAPALLALLAKDVDVMPSNIGDVLEHIKEGKLRALAVTGATRSPQLPDVPTLAEAGVKDYAAVGWMGFFAPAKTPAAIVDKLNRGIIDAIKSPDIEKLLVSQGFDIATNSPQEFERFVKEDIKRWAEAVKASGATAD